MKIKLLHPVGFEPTHPKITELESIALDHSATDACIVLSLSLYSDLAQR